jgi:ribosomal protein S17E
MKSTKLDFLKSIGESVAEEYFIDWDKWTDEETEKLEELTTISMKFYEKLFFEFDPDKDEHNIEMFEEILENLISGYTLQTIIARKKAVEELISTV